MTAGLTWAPETWHGHHPIRGDDLAPDEEKLASPRLGGIHTRSEADSRLGEHRGNCLARRLAEELEESGLRVGGTDAFLRMLVASSLADTGCTELIEALNTPGGYNQRLRLHMEECGMGQSLAEGLDKLDTGS